MTHIAADLCELPPPYCTRPAMSASANPSTASQPGPDHTKSERSSSGGRLPSLNQLAARIGANTPPSTNPSNRPRLAASLLRTGSQTSLSTTTSIADSVAVNAPLTRSTSPAALSTSPPNSTNGSVNGDAVTAAGPGEPLTAEKVEKLAQETAGLDKHTKKTKGFKNIPTLDAITAHYARTRTLSVDGTAVPPEAEPIEDPQTPGVMTKPPEHPLQHSWCVPLVKGGGKVPTRHPNHHFFFLFGSPGMTSFPIIKDDLPRHEDKGVHTDGRCLRSLVVPSTSRLGCLRSRSHDRGRVRDGRVVLPVFQLAQAAVQARA
jgi:hypothetical protein